MTEELKKLLEYQEVDSELAVIEKEFAENQIRKQYVIYGKKLSKVNDTLAEIEKKAADLHSQFEAGIKSIAELEEEKEQIEKTSKEDLDEVAVKYIKNQISSLVAEIDKLKNELETLNEAINSLVKDYSNYGKEIKEAKEIFKTVKPEYEKLKEEFETKKKAFEEKLDEKAKGINSGLLEKYKQKRKDKVSLPLILKSKDEFCAYCRQELPGNQYEKLKNGELIECEHCHKILYYEK